jgi:hypothetical protein
VEQWDVGRNGDATQHRRHSPRLMKRRSQMPQVQVAGTAWQTGTAIMIIG